MSQAELSDGPMLDTFGSLSGLPHLNQGTPCLSGSDWLWPQRNEEEI